MSIIAIETKNGRRYLIDERPGQKPRIMLDSDEPSPFAWMQPHEWVEFDEVDEVEIGHPMVARDGRAFLRTSKVVDVAEVDG